jgi:hypothetical protein
MNQLKNSFLVFSKELVELPKLEREDYFVKNLGSFFEKTTARKILLLGRAGTGKSSIKKIIFEGEDPKKLLLNPLEPTRGISPKVYSWLDLKLGVFDSSGQELSYLLDSGDESGFNLAFEQTDYIVYVIDYTLWQTKQDELKNDIHKIIEILKTRNFRAKLVIFVHKIDLIETLEYDKVKLEIKNNLENSFNYAIFFTSIHPDWIYSLYNAFYDILSNSSQETMNLMAILKEHMGETSKTMTFLTNVKDTIIVQDMTNDFNTNIINRSHKMIAELNQNFEEMSQEGRIDHLILSSEENFNIILNNLKLTKFGLKYIVVISESLSANKLILLVGQIRLKLKDYYYLEKRSA